MAVYEALLLNTVVPQIQAAQAGDSYVMVVNATTPALRITQTGTGDSILVEDAANPDSSPFVVTAAGDVGIGASSPGSKFQVSSSGKGTIFGSSAALNFYSAWQYNSTDVGYIGNGASIVGAAAATDFGLTAFTSGKLWLGSNNGASYAVLDTSGNLGLGVTPSAWSTFKAIDLFSTLGACLASTSGSMQLGMNFYYDGLSYRYKDTGYATRYEQLGGGAGDSSHAWFIAPSGTAGNAITFTQAMTLDASGNLGVGETSPSSYNKLTVNDNFGLVNSNSAKKISFWSTSNGISENAKISVENNGLTTNTGVMSFWTKDGTTLTERARITSGGYFKASDTGTYNNGTGSFHELYQTSSSEPAVVVTLQNASYVGNGLFVEAARNTTNNSFYAINYYNSGAGAFKFRVADSGDVTNTNGTYGTISDAKMKTDIVDAGSQWSDIKALRFRKFKMKDDPDQRVQLGVVAQEVELTSPGLVDEHQDRDAEGNDLGTTTKSVKTSVLLMKAAVALQEAMARIETLEAEVAALKGA